MIIYKIKIWNKNVIKQSVISNDWNFFNLMREQNVTDLIRFLKMKVKLTRNCLCTLFTFQKQTMHPACTQRLSQMSNCNVYGPIIVSLLVGAILEFSINTKKKPDILQRQGRRPWYHLGIFNICTQKNYILQRQTAIQGAFIPLCLLSNDSVGIREGLF